MGTSSTHPIADTGDASGQIRLYLTAFAIVLVAEFIGNVAIPMGHAKIVLLPLLWALLMGVGHPYLL